MLQKNRGRSILNGNESYFWVSQDIFKIVVLTKKYLWELSMKKERNGLKVLHKIGKSWVAVAAAGLID